MWEAQLGSPIGGWRVIAPHFRGFDGGDGRSGRRSSIDDYAADVIDLLDALHIDEAVIGGLSMGGYVAFAMFRHAPRYFQGLILADTKSQADTPEGVEGRKRMLQLVRREGTGGGCRRDDSEAARRDDAHARARTSSTRCERSCCRTPPRRSPAPSAR